MIQKKLQDVTDYVIESISTAYRENAPDFIYFYTLYNIARMVLTNEVSPKSINLPAGESVQNFFVLQISLKAEAFDP